MDEEEEDAFVYIFDRRSDSSVERQKVYIGGVFAFDGFQEKISEVYFECDVLYCLALSCHTVLVHTQ